MWAVGIERLRGLRRVGGGATVPARYCSHERGRGPAIRAMRGVGNAGRGALPTASKREGFFPSNLLLD
jgi:hypothetical protein